jgi:hypothetical protein
VNTVFDDGEDSFFFRYFVSGVCFIFYVLFSLIGCAGSVGFFLASRVMHIFRVCVSAVWSAGPVQVNLGILLGRVAALYRFSFFSGAVVAGTVRLK